MAVCLAARLPSKGRKSDCLIVLGALVRPDGQMSHALLYRCEAALGARTAGLAPVLILSGGCGAGERQTEASAMAAWFAAQGVPPEALILEERSANTLENLRNAREIMRARGFRTAAIVTSDYHLRRALYLARRLGMEVCGIPARSSRRPARWMKSRIRESGSWIRLFFRKVH